MKYIRISHTDLVYNHASCVESCVDIKGTVAPYKLALATMNRNHQIEEVMLPQSALCKLSVVTEAKTFLCECRNLLKC